MDEFLERPAVKRVREAPAAAGFAIGGVPPIAHAQPIAVLIDASLARFEALYAAAGHPHCVFATTLDELAGLTGAPVVEGLGVQAAAAPEKGG